MAKDKQMIETRKVEDPLELGKPVKGNTDIIGVFSLSNWYDVEYDMHKVRLLGTIGIYDPESGYTRTARIGANVRIGKEYEEKMLDDWDDLQHDLKLAIRRELYYRTNVGSYDKEIPERPDDFVYPISCRVMFENYKLRKGDLEQRVVERYYTIESVDERVLSEESELSRCIVPDLLPLMGEDCYSPETDIDLQGRSPE